ncbi:MAG: GH92 family glycosyl hydrolase [Parabacteroides sp.]|nr:GH92 family glycosyl hydrolase [Parabacteroides sp.]
MNKIFIVVILSCLGLMQESSLTAKTVFSKNAEKINTLIGTEAGGNTFPGAAYPFGMVQFTRTCFNPQAGFVINQLSGAGCPQMGHFPTIPMNGDLKVSPDSIQNMDVQITNEQAVSGYYRAVVNNNINAEFTVTGRTGMSQYTFSPETNRATVIIGGGVSITPLEYATVVITGKHTCEGFADGGMFCDKLTPYKIYFAAEFNGDVVSYGTWNGDKLKPNTTFAEGKHSGVYFTFDVKSHKKVQYKIGISYVSLENAHENLEAENSEWNFTAIKESAINEWEKYLSKIQIQGTNGNRISQFYTHLYHALIHPNICSDVNGEYMGADFKVHKTIKKQYTSFSNWDTYRTQIQLLSILDPEVASDVITSMLDFAEQSGGGFPRWIIANLETGIMQGDPTAIYVANAYAFGAKNFDCSKALKIMRHGADDPTAHSQKELTRPYLGYLLRLGWCPASMQLEYNSADFAIGQFALNACNDKVSYELYVKKRAQTWKNLYNPATRWLQSRNWDGSWKDLKYDFRESTYNNYIWMIPFNFQGVINIIGGKEEAEKRLDYLFRRIDAGYDDTWYASGNEPSFGIPWVYNWVGRPYKTQAIVNRIIKEMYHNTPDGLPGNDDLGSMSAWYVFSCLGIYPEIPGVGGFSINAPIFSEVKISINGNDLLIKGGSDDKCYIQNLKLNGKMYNSTWITWNEIAKGGTLDFKLSSNPNKKWGTVDVPPSFE